MDCTQNYDALKLIREGLSQEQRRKDAPNPALVQVNEHTPAHLMAFAKTYAGWLQYYNEDNTVSGNWEKFFDNDVSALLAIAAIERIELYTVTIQEHFEFLNDLEHKGQVTQLKNHLGSLFSILASLAKQIDLLMLALPKELKLKSTLKNLIQSRLAPDLQKLIAYHQGGIALNRINDVIPQTDMFLFGKPVKTFSSIITQGLSPDWITDGSSNWTTYVTNILATPITSIYGNGPTVFDQINHIATHNLFTSIFDQFLKVYTRIIRDANTELTQTLEDWPSHKPHYALFLSFLLLNEYARKETNTLTARHLDYYYRDILHLKEKPASPSMVHVLLELAKNKASLELKEKTPFNAKKDALSKDVIFTNDVPFVANQAKVTELRSLYKHVNDTNETLTGMNNRFFASPIANSEDGIGGPLLSEEQSWHPLFSKIYDGDLLTSINMPKAKIGFALSSHYLLMAEGTRTITLDIPIESSVVLSLQDYGSDVSCLFSKADGWLEKSPVHFKRTSSTNLQLQIIVAGNDPAITPYDIKTHGYHFEISHPTFILALRQDTSSYIYTILEHITVSSITLTVEVAGLKTLAVNNDFGPVDTSKPFLPFGSSPIKGSSFVFGSKELFQKMASSANPVKLKIDWQVDGIKYGTDAPSAPLVTIGYLANGNWATSSGNTLFSAETSEITFPGINGSVLVAPDYSENEILGTSSAYGYIKVTLDDHFGQEEYLIALRDYLLLKATDGTEDPPPTAPQIPIASGFSINYTAVQTINISSASEEVFNDRQARFFHVAPFGESEQHAYLTPMADRVVHLIPQFGFYRDGEPKQSLAEFYIGIKGLVPPQNLALLFQVSDGTADPLTQKPGAGKHIHWSFLQNNEWASFESQEIVDTTAELIKSGIVTLSIPREANDTNTLLPTGLHWIRLAVNEKTEAICRLLGVAAQAVLTTFSDQDNDPNFPAQTVPAGTITKLVNPDSGIKKVTQPYDSFGGKGKETADDFFKRISERLRHKDRAITLWDYEHLVLEEFPKIYKVKCLNHTEYEPTENSLGTYREIAPGHVTIVTIPNQDNMKVRNSLRPYTSLGTLDDIKTFLKSKLSCHAKLHVCNPQFEEVMTEFGVHFYEGYDETYYKIKLQEEITRFLSPWAFPGGGNPSFGGKIYKSVLINFVEDRSYVDYITEFKLKFKAGGAAGFSSDLNEVVASTAVSILVSVPADQHIITPIDEEEAEVSNESCSCTS